MVEIFNAGIKTQFSLKRQSVLRNSLLIATSSVTVMTKAIITYCIQSVICFYRTGEVHICIETREKQWKNSLNVENKGVHEDKLGGLFMISMFFPDF